MAYLVKKLPGAAQNYAARDADGTMKTITTAGVRFERAPAADPWLEIVEIATLPSAVPTSTTPVEPTTTPSVPTKGKGRR